MFCSNYTVVALKCLPFPENEVQDHTTDLLFQACLTCRDTGLARKVSFCRCDTEEGLPAESAFIHTNYLNFSGRHKGTVREVRPRAVGRWHKARKQKDTRECSQVLTYEKTTFLKN